MHLRTGARPWLRTFGGTMMTASVPASGSYGGVDYRYEYIQGYGQDEIRISVPADGTTTFEFQENDEVADWIRRIGAAISGKTIVKSGDPRFDRKVMPGRTTNSTVAMMRDLELRNSIEALIDLGFIRIRRYGSQVEATWLPGYRFGKFEAAKILPTALPLMARLAAARPNSDMRLRPVLSQRNEGEKFEAPNKRKSLLATWMLASFLVVPGYWYVGGWRHALPVAALWIPVIYLVDTLPRDLGIFILSTFMIVGFWKAGVACALRNKLVGKDAVPAEHFDSSQYGIYALLDLALGLGMGASACASFLLLGRLQAMTGEIAHYFVAVPLAVWVTELILGYAFLRLAGPLSTPLNPFLVQQYSRWRIGLSSVGSGQIAPRSPISWLLPSWREAARALILPASIALLAMVSAR